MDTTLKPYRLHMMAFVFDSIQKQQKQYLLHVMMYVLLEFSYLVLEYRQ